MDNALMEAKKKNTKYYINAAICIVIMLIGQLMPAAGAITQLGMKVLFIYIGLLWGWSTVGLIWPSFLGIIMLGLSGYDSVGNLIVSGFGNSTNVYIMLMLIYSYFVTSSGTADILIRAIISRKFANGKPWVISWLILTASYVTAFLITLTPAAIIVWAILVKYCSDIGYKKGDKYPIVMIIGIAQAALMGYSVVPYHLPAQVLVGMAEQAGSPVGFAPFFVVAFVIGYGSVILYLLAMRFIIRPDVENLKKEYDFSTSEKMTPYQKKIFITIPLLIICFFVQSTFPKTFIGAFLSKLGTSGIVMAFLMVMAFFKKKDGTPFADIVEGTKKGVAWPVFFCLTVGMTIATALGSADLGIKDQIQIALSPFFGSSSAQFILLAFAIIVMLIMTNFMGNYSCAIIMYTVCIQFADTLGIRPALLACLLGVLANCSIVFPSANPLAAMMHGMKDWLEAKDIYRYAVTMVVCCAICALFVAATFGNAIFG